MNLFKKGYPCVVPIIGAHNTGKSTLLDWLADEHRFNVFPEIARKVQDVTNNKTFANLTDIGIAEQLAYFFAELERHKALLSLKRGKKPVFTDRSPLDNLAYLKAKIDYGRFTYDYSGVYKQLVQTLIQENLEYPIIFLKKVNGRGRAFLGAIQIDPQVIEDNIIKLLKEVGWYDKTVLLQDESSTETEMCKNCFEQIKEACKEI